MQKRAIAVGSILALAGFLELASEAEAKTVIKNPDEHPDYRAELEPHGTLVLWHRYYNRRYRYYGRGPFETPEFGAGFRATIEIADPAFIPKINNTVGITFGIDATTCRYCYREDVTLWLPVAMQWNFFLTDKWSVFAELGLVPRIDGFNDVYAYLDPLFELGGRYHFNDTVALTMRIGYPFINVGVSFFVGG